MRKKTSIVKKLLPLFLFCLGSLFLAGCEDQQSIVNNLDEREANEIIVFLASKGIDGEKLQAEKAQVGGTGGPILWNINVKESESVEAMSLLNRQGLPRRKGATLLSLFAKEGLMTSDKEENIRYRAGIEEELTNTIRKIDGVLDADVKISFPTTEAVGIGTTEPPKIKAAVYVKHQGMLDDPNAHIESKIKKLLSGSVEGLDYDAVSVITDKARLFDVGLGADGELISHKERDKDYVSIWSVEMSKSSASHFRTIFFTLIFLVLIFGGFMGWILYKFFPYILKARAAAKSLENENDQTSKKE